MTKIKLDQVLKGLDGEPLVENGKQILFSEAIANVLTRNPSAENSDTLRLYTLGQKLYTSKLYEPSSIEELQFIEKYVKSAPYIPLIKGQILQEIDRAIREMDKK